MWVYYSRYKMSIVVSNLSYNHPDKQPLFRNISISVPDGGKVSIVGCNGVGKSTLLKLLAGELLPLQGSIKCTEKPYYVPQLLGQMHISIAEALQVKVKLDALAAIAAGSVDPADFDIVGDDWDVETRVRQALSFWGLSYVGINDPMDNLSGGERTKVYLAGIQVHSPLVVLLDEPTNHLDVEGRVLLYTYVKQSAAVILLISHDIQLLNLVNVTYEMRASGVKLYGGGYDFYEQQKTLEENALNEHIDAEHKALRVAQKKAREVKVRQEKRIREGEKMSGQVPRIMVKTLKDSADRTSRKLGDKHTKIVDEHKEKLSELRQERGTVAELKMDFDNASLHTGKRLVQAKNLRYAFQSDVWLWENPLDVEVLSGDRIFIKGANGSGKTTLIKLLLGELKPVSGSVERTDFSYVYLDQSYSQMDKNCTILEMVEFYNVNHLEEHELKIRLNRFLFPPDTWGKSTYQLSGGEKMRLYLCCLMVSNHTPDVFVLDEPTNNLDISSLKILLGTVKQYKGTILLVTHDTYFAQQIEVTKEVELV